MKRTILTVVCLLLVVAAGLTLNPLRPREATGQDDLSSDIAGVYVEVSPPAGSSPRVVVIFADGNWTVRVADVPPSFGVWQESEEQPTADALMLDAILAPGLDRTGTGTGTDTGTSTNTGTGTGTSTDTSTDTDITAAAYTLVFDEMFETVIVTNTSTLEEFTAQRLSVTDTDTGTGTDTDTGTGTDTDTGTGTDTDTGTGTDTSTGTSTGTNTGTGTGTTTQ